MSKIASWPNSICYTGGEPFLQQNEELKELTLGLSSQGYTIECFSNGTIPYPPWATRIKFIMDWKLYGSGEDPHDKKRLVNLTRLNCEDAVKFTIADRYDYDLAAEIYHQYIRTIPRPAKRPQVFVGVVWDKLENAELVEWMLSDGLNWRHNMQVHNIIWDRNKRGI